MDKEDFASKVDNEGGVWEAYHYGIDPDEIEDAEVSALWRQLVEKFREADEIVDKLYEKGALL